ncbi:hypothetical protein ASD50_04115 [Mesorhizobium sp. Root552]|uniref:hypothetical protein n=1 Tax=Mesorhizobium sp. Root552 TaxID=1736555 RepID=UPI0007007E96|nr:hypothetical protein [Mesorhizobium sp. Root552]KQZ26594.1 hypothetical protein ASD50_04115 [Mesorhizobium sp. Root552]
MKLVMLAAALVLGVSQTPGCGNKNGATTSADQGASAASAQSGDGLNCELKNGPTGCVDEKAQAAEAKRQQDAKSASLATPDTSSKKPQHVAEADFQPWMCKQGGGGFFGFWSSAFTANLDNLMEYCRQIEAPVEASTVASDDTGIDKSGTWTCQLANGAGPIYGVYEMVNSPRIVASTCKRVAD